ncbi:MAG: SH3 domain-containing protein [Myxococcales bacterium]|nr:SH3 domain-containing protein [Myxococcales bacterium]
MTQTKLLLGGLLLMVAGTTLAGCSGDIDDEGVADEAALTSGVSGELAVGTELTTTARVNFRTGPSTSTAVKRILAKGSTVVTVNRTRPSGAFYNVKSGNDEGWVHGGYPRQGRERRDGANAHADTDARWHLCPAQAPLLGGRTPELAGGGLRVRLGRQRDGRRIGPLLERVHLLRGAGAPARLASLRLPRRAMRRHGRRR